MRTNLLTKLLLATQKTISDQNVINHLIANALSWLCNLSKKPLPGRLSDRRYSWV